MKFFIVLFASVLAVNAFPTGNEPVKIDQQLSPNIEKLAKCSNVLESKQSICVPKGFNLDFKTIQIWAHDQVKCCDAWKTYDCLKNTALKAPDCAGVIDQMLAGWGKEVEGTFRGAGCMPDKCHK